VTARGAASAREVALRVVSDVFGPQERTAQAAFDYRAREAGLDERDRNFAAELAYGSIKRRRTIDWYLTPYIGSRSKPLPPTIVEVLRLGVQQMLFMAGVDPHAAVYETVELAKRHGHRGTAGLVNAVMRRLQADAPPGPERERFKSDEEWLGVRYSMPTWLVTQLSSAFPADLAAICAGLDAAPQHALRVNTLRAGVEDALAALREAGGLCEPSPFVSESIIVHGAVCDDPQGRWNVQGESSAMPADLLDPQPGETVFDLCSGRGNKSVQIAARLKGSGSLTCVERDERKARAWRENLERAGAIAALVEGDVEAFEPGEPADAVLLDAPCSAVGTIGRHAESRWRKTPADGARLAGVQSALLARAADLVKPGGRLVYAVCSFDPREGHEVIERFLSERGGFERIPPPDRYAPFAAGGAVLVPPGLAGRDGFYISALRRSTAP
jgi:16S rRNA (cytosine967-C5)-methyltransferase